MIVTEREREAQGEAGSMHREPNVGFDPRLSPAVAQHGVCLKLPLFGRGVVGGTQAAALKMNVIQIVCDHWVHILVPLGFLTAFWNKSLLFRRELRPSEEVTWK
ncbi:unnamed protein product [Nyctereutes procyonoides]|uniref:NADH dehydrogenase [ubiquinone] 1 beta subcomplex subunit 1 n=1 Tax=Nyctereutes procyonoides TaxID=34880 RepID=A0A811ZQY1_NYCPR|nr:unnamed protein product [Nyctereutes procyonoides]